MNIVFVSNYYTHHQSAFSELMNAMNGIDYNFIETETMETERIKMGWSISAPKFVININDSKALCINMVKNADVVIFGNTPNFLLKLRVQTKKLTFIYTERIYKDGFSVFKWPIRFVRINEKYNHKNLFLLCAGAYTYCDFFKTFTFLNKAYKWGYFTELRKYDSIENIIETKTPNSILWVGRLIDWKHPEIPVLLAERMKIENIPFHLTIIGDGVLKDKICNMIHEKHLENDVMLIDSLSPCEVRDIMEKNQIFIFTSDFHEGWGAVLNEAMNSGCAVVASHAIGASQFLLDDGIDGYIYPNGNFDALFRYTKSLLTNNALRKRFGILAYKKIKDVWNAKTAAYNLMSLINSILKKEHFEIRSGPCSKAELIRKKYKVDLH